MIMILDQSSIARVNALALSTDAQGNGPPFYSSTGSIVRFLGALYHSRKPMPSEEQTDYRRLIFCHGLYLQIFRQSCEQAYGCHPFQGEIVNRKENNRFDFMILGQKLLGKLTLIVEYKKKREISPL